MKVVELHQAWGFTCEECGKDSFIVAMHTEMSDNQALEIAKKLGIIDEFEEVESDKIEAIKRGVVTFPSEVKCRHCGANFKTNSDVDFERENQAEDDNEF